MVGHAGEGLAEAVSERLAVVGVGAHLVRLVDDDQVPVRAEQALLGVLDARDPGDRRDDLIAVLPGVVSIVCAKRLAPDDLEALAELVLEFTLPLERQVRRGDDQRPTDKSPSLEFLEQQPGHDRLARAGSSARRKRMRGSLRK